MIIAFIIALCLNKCKLQAYVQGKCYKKNEVTWEWGKSKQVPIRNKMGVLWYKRNINTFTPFCVITQQSRLPGCDWTVTTANMWRDLQSQGGGVCSHTQGCDSTVQRTGWRPPLWQPANYLSVQAVCVCGGGIQLILLNSSKTAGISWSIIKSVSKVSQYAPSALFLPSTLLFKVANSAKWSLVVLELFWHWQ